MFEDKKCEFCDKRGLPLLLVRDAIAPSGVGAPQAPDLPIKLASQAAYYTKRLLRSGYVNIYDEVRRRWEEYFVTVDGYLFKLTDTPGIIPPVPSKLFNCLDETHRAVAGCITISDPNNATKIWIGFSDCRWSVRTRQANEEPAYRMRHMVALDVKAALGLSCLANTLPISEVSTLVAEYAMDGKKGREAFSWSPFGFDPRHTRAQSLIDQFNKLRPGKGLIVTLPDPAGIAREIGILIHRNTELFIRNPKHERNLAASAAIDSIEEAIRTQAEQQLIVASDQLADQSIAANPLGHWLSESTRLNTEKLRNVSAEQADRAANEAWEKYEKKFDNSSRKAWLEKFKKELQPYDEAFIAPLAENHVEWMKSDNLLQYFNCNYDNRDIYTGEVFNRVFTSCIAATQDKKACSDLYTKWLNGTATDDTNLLIRALIFNDKATADAIGKATTVSIDSRQIPWDNVFAIYTNAVGTLSPASRDTGGLLVVQLAGPIMRMLDKVVDLPATMWSGAIALGLIAGHPLVVCDIVGTKRQFHTLLRKELLHLSGKVISEKRMTTAVNMELRRLEIRGVKLSSTNKRRWVVLADKRIAKNLPIGLNQRELAQSLAKSLTTVSAVEKANVERWNKIIDKEFRFGVVAGVLQAWILTKLIEDEGKSLNNENQDAKIRMYTGALAVAGTVSEIIGNTVAKRVDPALRFGQGFSVTLAKTFQAAGKLAGIAGGIIVATMDAAKFLSSLKESQIGLAWLYAGSVVAGLGLTAAIAAASTIGAIAVPIIGILILVIIGLSLLIEYIKDNPVQDWLERTPWGIMATERYPDIVTEQDQLSKALG